MVVGLVLEGVVVVASSGARGGNDLLGVVWQEGPNGWHLGRVVYVCRRWAGLCHGVFGFAGRVEVVLLELAGVSVSRVA